MSKRKLEPECIEIARRLRNTDPLFDELITRYDAMADAPDADAVETEFDKFTTAAMKLKDRKRR